MADDDPPVLSHNTKVLSAVSLAQDAASEMLYPVLPIFLTTVLGAPAAAVGVIEGLADATAAGAKLVAGRLADRRARRPLIGLGYGLAGVAKALVAAAWIWPVVLFARVVDRLGKGIRGAPRDALLADGTAPQHLGRAFGFHRAADTTGAVIGPLAGLALYHAFGGRIRPLLWFAVIPAAISIGLVVLVRETHPPARDRPTKPLALDARWLRPMAPLVAHAFVNFPDALLLLRAKHLGLGTGQVIAAYALYNAVYAGLSYPAGVLADRVPHRLLVTAGLVAFALTYGGLGLATTSGWVWPLLAGYGAFNGLTDGVGKAWLSGLVPPEGRGSALGTFQAVTGVGVLAAGLWAGLSWGDGGRVPLLIAGAVALAVAAWLAVWRPAPTGPAAA